MHSHFAGVYFGRFVTLLVVGLAALPSTPVQATPLMVVASVKPPPNLLAMASTASQCIALTYDRNGNRIVQTVTPVTGTTTIWGSGTYGCFIWRP